MERLLFAFAIGIPPFCFAALRLRWERNRKEESFVFAVWGRNILIVNAILFACPTLYSSHGEAPINSIILWLLLSILFNIFLFGIDLIVYYIKSHRQNLKVEKEIEEKFKQEADNTGYASSKWSWQVICCSVLMFTLSAAFFLNNTVAVKLYMSEQSQPNCAILYYFYGEATDASDRSGVIPWKKDNSVRLCVPLSPLKPQQIRLDPVYSSGERYEIEKVRLTVCGVPFVEEYDSAHIQEILNENGHIYRTETTENGLRLNIEESGQEITMLSEEFVRSVGQATQIGVVCSVLLSLLLTVAVFCLLRVKTVEAWMAENVFQPLKNVRFSRMGLAAASIHFLICFWLQHAAFQFSSEFTTRILMYEILFFLFLLLIWQGGIQIVGRFRTGDKRTKEFLLYGGVYFLFLFIGLLSVWPIYFEIDEWVIYDRLFEEWLMGGYSKFLSLEMLFGAMLFPSVAGGSILQIFIISIIAGVILTEFASFLPNKRWIWLCYIPLLTPTLLLNCLGFKRTIMPAWIEFYFLADVAFTLLRKRRVTFYRCLKWAFLIGILTSCGMDGVYYMLAAPVIIWILMRPYAKKACLAFMLIASVLLSSILQTVQYNRQEQSFVLGVNLARLLVAVAKEADPETEYAELSALDKVVDVDAYRKGEVIMRDYAYYMNDNDSAALKRAAVSLIVRHPVAYLKQQWDTFFASSGKGPDAFYAFQANEDLWAGDYGRPDLLDSIYSNPLNDPISQPLRKKAVLLAQAREGSFGELSPLSPVLLDLFTPLIALICLWLFLLLKKKYSFWLLTSLFLLRVPILFLAAPYISYLYWIRFALAGWSLPFWFLAYKCAIGFRGSEKCFKEKEDYL